MDDLALQVSESNNDALHQSDDELEELKRRLQALECQLPLEEETEHKSAQLTPLPLWMKFLSTRGETPFPKDSTDHYIPLCAWTCRDDFERGLTLPKNVEPPLLKTPRSAFSIPLSSFCCRYEYNDLLIYEHPLSFFFFHLLFADFEKDEDEDEELEQPEEQTAKREIKYLTIKNKLPPPKKKKRQEQEEQKIAFYKGHLPSYFRVHIHAHLLFCSLHKFLRKFCWSYTCLVDML